MERAATDWLLWILFFGPAIWMRLPVSLLHAVQRLVASASAPGSSQHEEDGDTMTTTMVQERRRQEGWQAQDQDRVHR